MTTEKDKLADVIPIDRRKPQPIPPTYPQGTPSPEDALIEWYDLINGNNEDSDNGKE